MKRRPRGSYNMTEEGIKTKSNMMRGNNFHKGCKNVRGCKEKDKRSSHRDEII